MSQNRPPLTSHSEWPHRGGASGRDAAPTSLPEPIPSAPSGAGEAYVARLLGSSRRGLPRPSGALRNGGLSLARSRRGSAPHSFVDACAQGRPPDVCAFLRLACAHQPQYEQVPAAPAPWLHGPHISSIPRRSHSVASIFSPHWHPFSRSMPSHRLGACPAAFVVALD